MMTPTARSLAKLRDEGWLCQVVERFNTFSKTRVDLFGFIDIIAVRDGETLGVQATSGSNVSSRVEKIANHDNVGRVREAGWRIEVWGWRRDSKKKWVCRVVDCS